MRGYADLIDQYDELQRENDQLRKLLAIARSALGTCSAILLEKWHPFSLEAENALRRSDPDARAEIGQARGL